MSDRSDAFTAILNQLDVDEVEGLAATRMLPHVYEWLRWLAVR